MFRMNQFYDMGMLIKIHVGYMYEIYHGYTSTADLLFATLMVLPVAMQKSITLRHGVVS